jgi:hypothetical protein
MRQAFRTSLRGRPRAAGFWTDLVRDWIASAVKERLSAWSTSGILLLLAALLSGTFASCVDFGNDEVQAPVLVVMVSCFILSLIRPRAALRWTLIVALSLPIGRWLGPCFGFYPKLPATPNNFATLIALIPAVIASYSAVAIRAVTRLAQR